MWMEFNKLGLPRKNNPASPFDDVCDDGYRYVGKVGKGKCPSRRSNICTAIAIVAVPLLVGCWLVWVL